MDYSMFKTIEVDLKLNGVAVLTLKRPDAQNSFNADMVRDLLRAYHDFDWDVRVRVVVMTGHGKFSVLADLRETDFSESTNSRDKTPKTPLQKFHDDRDGGGMVSLAIHRCRKVTIAAINGPAVGVSCLQFGILYSHLRVQVGITMKLGQDIRFTWKDAKVGFGFGRRGIVIGGMQQLFLPRLVGHSRALELVLPAHVAPASHPSLALLFAEVLEKREDVLPKALELANENATKTWALSNAMAKALIWRGGASAEEVQGSVQTGVGQLLSRENLCTAGAVARLFQGFPASAKSNGVLPSEFLMSVRAP